MKGNRNLTGSFSEQLMLIELDQASYRLNDYRGKVQVDPMMRERGDRRFKGINGVDWWADTDHWEVYIPHKGRWFHVTVDSATEYSAWIGQGDSGYKLRLAQGPMMEPVYRVSVYL